VRFICAILSSPRWRGAGSISARSVFAFKGGEIRGLRATCEQEFSICDGAGVAVGGAARGVAGGNAVASVAQSEAERQGVTESAIYNQIRRGLYSGLVVRPVDNKLSFVRWENSEVRTSKGFGAKHSTFNAQHSTLNGDCRRDAGSALGEARRYDECGARRGGGFATWQT
jgi:hypothetical protein